MDRTLGLSEMETLPDHYRHVVLASRPKGLPVPENFRVEEVPMPTIAEGEFLCQNLYISLDAGFRHWMDEGSGDNIIPAMPIDAPVMSLTLGRVVLSRNADFQPGDLLMARLAWEEYSVTSGDDFHSRLPTNPLKPLSLYLGVLGDTGLSGYFGLNDYGRIQPGETVLVSAAAGAVGSIAGQIATLLGGRAVGISSSEEKCQRLISELGYAAAINRNEADFDRALEQACPQGVDVYFDNVAGPMLESVLNHINEDARILLCGAVADYNETQPRPGPNNLFQLVTKHAHMHGFMTHLNSDRYDAARAELSGWLDEGKLVAPEYVLNGIEQAGQAFSDLFRGMNFGKTLVSLNAD